MGICEDRITEDSTEFEKAFLKIYDGNLWTALDKMKDWQPPKPLVAVPQIIGDWIELIKQRNRNVLALLDSDDMPCDVYDWLFIKEDDENIKLILLAWVKGYTVEKPQLFYLKNKIKLEDVGNDLIGYLNLFLTNDGYLTSNINRAKKFTHQEIDSMQTSSYKQIEVES